MFAGWLALQNFSDECFLKMSCQKRLRAYDILDALYSKLVE
jgi:hypothetical protein